MRVTVNHGMKTVMIWLGKDEKVNEDALPHKSGYRRVLFRSGNASLEEKTSALLNNYSQN